MSGLSLLQLTPQEQARAAEIERYALDPAHFFRGDEPPPPVPPEHHMEIGPMVVVFRVVTQRGAPYRHLTVLQRPAGSWPHPMLFEGVARVFGFTGEMDGWDFLTCDLVGGHVCVVALQRMEDD